MQWISETLSMLRIQDVIDIAIVAVIIYWLFKLIKGTRAEQLSKGIVVVLLLTKISEILQIYMLNYLLKSMLTWGFLGLFIVFQPEIRRGLEFIGRNSSLRKGFVLSQSRDESTIKEIISAVASLSRQKIGALMVIERKTGLNEIIETGTGIYGELSSGLLINIFIPNTPLHDGAVVINGDKIISAACFLPLTEEKGLSKELGTRHRAAIGISEKSDAFSIVVSEETGSISVAEYGQINRHLDLSTLEQMLRAIYFPENDEGVV